MDGEYRTFDLYVTGHCIAPDRLNMLQGTAIVDMAITITAY